jgi:uncharacterized protein (TIRG00374 family)
VKNVKQVAWGFVRLGIGIGIVALLLLNINRGSARIEFHVPRATVAEGAMYAPGTNSPLSFIVLDAADDADTITVLATGAKELDLPEQGVLVRTQGEGPDTLPWSGRRIDVCGLRILGDTFVQARHRWLLLLCGVGAFFLCLVLCAVRWKFILDAHDIHLPWGKTVSVFMIGHFFNAFMFGATGGDVVKAYYAARETGHKKAEAVATVFIDRVVGLAALILLAAGTMLFRLKFFLADTRTRWALVFIGGLAVGVVGAFVAMLIVKRFMDRWLWLQRMLATRVGSIFKRVYDSFYLCLTHPSLLMKIFPLALFIQFIIVVMMFFLGEALSVNRPFVDYLSLTPTINALGCVPVTPGGLGLREYAAVFFMDVVGVPATRSMPMSLSVYAIMLFWSLVGGLVFMVKGASAPQAFEEPVGEDG